LGETLLQPTHIYANLVDMLFSEGIDIHYMVNITGHGWRKLMRAEESFSYKIKKIPPISPLFTFIQKHSGIDDREMYGNFNMGAGFALFIPKKDVTNAQKLIKKLDFECWNAGVVEEGQKQVIIEPKNITFSEKALQLR
jgi:phosphoribosylformylglycinamidine cyclo-ligase